MCDCTEYRYSERGRIRPGDLFRARGGTTYNGRRVAPRGRFRAIGIETHKRGIYIHAARVDKYGIQCSGTVLLYVDGKPYHPEGLPDGWIVKPSRVAKCRR